jgi:surface carbohydrate biosynthesis protein
MKGSHPLLIVPVENQVRELEPKLLFACVAVQRGFSVLIGSRMDVDFQVGGAQPGIYVAKSMTPRSRRMFRILQRLGHEIVAWDEEAVNTFALPEVYYSRRFAPETFGAISHLFAWGEANAELFRKYPSYPGTPIHVTGNPRGDLLRPELRPYWAAEADRCRADAGDFILINTNFAHVNAFYPVLNLFQPAVGDAPPEIGRAAIGMTRAYAEGRAIHKQLVFESFQKLIPFLHDAFPEQNVVVRPHPIENPTVYQELASRHPRVRVVKDGGNPIPWLLAARALVHCSCTTGLESWLTETPTIAYRPDPSETYEEPLPNALSHSCFDLAAVGRTLEGILAGEIGRFDGEEPRRLVAHHLSATSGELASDRILDVLERVEAERRRRPGPGLIARLDGRWDATRRRLKKLRKSRRPDSKNRPEFQRYRYPGLEPEEMQERIERFQRVLGQRTPVRVTPVADHVYRLDP